MIQAKHFEWKKEMKNILIYCFPTGRIFNTMILQFKMLNTLFCKNIFSLNWILNLVTENEDINTLLLVQLVKFDLIKSSLIKN